MNVKLCSIGILTVLVSSALCVGGVTLPSTMPTVENDTPKISDYYSNDITQIVSVSKNIRFMETKKLDVNFYQQKPAKFIGGFKEWCVDTDNDTRYNFLKAVARINVTVPGVYLFGFRAYDSVLQRLLTLNFSAYYIKKAGNYTIPFELNGEALNNSKLNDTYKAVSLLYDSQGRRIDYMINTTRYYNYTQFEEPRAWIERPYSDYPLDINNNTKYDFIVVEVTVNVTKPGKYTVYLEPYDSTTHYYLVSNITTVNLTTGSNVVKTYIDGRNVYASKINNSAILFAVALYDENFNWSRFPFTYYNLHIDISTGSGIYNYKDFELPDAYLLRPYKEYPIDTNNDTYYDYLRVEYKFSVTKQSNYTVLAGLFQESGKPPAIDINVSHQGNTSVGVYNLISDFNGTKIYQSTISGPYLVKFNVLNISDELIDYDTLLTNAYSYSDFQPPQNLLPPRIIRVFPANASTNISINLNITVEFSEPINITTFDYKCIPDPGNWKVNWDPTRTIVQLAHDDFQYNTNYTFKVLAADDDDGNPLANPPHSLPHEFVFSTYKDTTPPTAVALINGKKNVTIDQHTTVALQGNKSSDNVGIVNWTWKFIDIVPKELYGEIVTYRFDHPIGKTEIRLFVYDAAGNVGEDTANITVRDAEKPKAVAKVDGKKEITVVQGTTVEFNATESSDNVGIANYTWTFVDVTQQTLEGKVVKYTFNNMGQFLITLTVKDFEGNTATDTATVNVEKKPDTTPPEIVDKSPTGTTVGIETLIKITFSEPMNKSSVEKAFSITPSVEGKKSWDKNTMIFDPDKDLEYETEYTVRVTTDARDLAGNRLKSEMKWSFTTIKKPVKEDKDPPVIVHTPVPSADENTDIIIRAEVTDNVKVAEVKLYYRKKGENFTSVAMGASAGEYIATIPKEVVTPAGVEYYIEAKDTSGNTATNPTGAPTNFHKIDVKKKEKEEVPWVAVAAVIVIIIILLIIAIALMRKKEELPPEKEEEEEVEKEEEKEEKEEEEEEEKNI